MISPFPGYEVAKERRRDLERELEHRRLITEIENKDEAQSRRRKLMFGASSMIVAMMVAAQFLTIN